MNAHLRTQQRHRVSDWIAIAGWLPRYRSEWLSHDVVASLTAAAALIDLEYAALRMLTEAEARLRVNGMEVWLAVPLPGVLNMITRSSLGDALGREHIFLSAQIALAHYEELHPPHLLSDPASSQQLHRMRGHYE
jgi:hypothetical protein